MVQAGAKPVNWGAVVSKWTPDFTAPERNLLTEAMLQHGGPASVVPLSAGGCEHFRCE
jgi:hypothetical protein